MILKLTTITTSADTAVVSAIPLAAVNNMVQAATTLTVNYANAANAVKAIVFTVNGTNAAEKQLNVDKLMDWMAGLVESHRFSNVVTPAVYTANHATITAQAGLKWTGATTAPLVTTTVAI
jgi:hypothetical protein